MTSPTLLMWKKRFKKLITQNMQTGVLAWVKTFWMIFAELFAIIAISFSVIILVHLVVVYIHTDETPTKHGYNELVNELPDERTANNRVQPKEYEILVSLEPGVLEQRLSMTEHKQCMKVALAEYMRGGNIVISKIAFDTIEGACVDAYNREIERLRESVHGLEKKELIEKQLSIITNF